MAKTRIPFIDIFDMAMAVSDDRKIVPRNYMYASELGGSFYDRWHSMQGRTPTNPPNEVAIRKFKIGHLIEDYFKLALFMCGILEGSEERVINGKYGIDVSGKLDVRYGGNMHHKTDGFISFPFLGFFPYVQNAILEFVKHNPNLEIEEGLIEVKSCSDYTFNRILDNNCAEEHHALQAFHYCYTKNTPIQIVYFDKNNGRIKDFWIEPNDAYLLRLYVDDIEKMTYYYENNIEPQKEGFLVFDGKKITLNWKVLYSKYLKDYGFETKQDLKDHYDGDIRSWNYVLKRYFDGKETTEKNKEKFREMVKAGAQLPKEIMKIISANQTTKKDTDENKLDTLTKLKQIASQKN